MTVLRAEDLSQDSRPMKEQKYIKLSSGLEHKLVTDQSKYHVRNAVDD